MMTSSIFDFQPPVSGSVANSRVLLAEAQSHAFGVTDPTLRKLLANLLVEHPDWMAKPTDHVSLPAYSEFLNGVLAPDKSIYYLAMQQYAASDSRLRQSIKTGRLTGWDHCNLGIAAALDRRLQTVDFITLLHAATSPILRGFLLLLLGLLEAKVAPTSLVRRRKPDTLALAGIQALESKGHLDALLTFRPFRSESVRVLTTRRELHQTAIRMNNCLWDPHWAVATLLGRLLIVFVDFGGIQAVAELVPSEDSWIPRAILGKGNARLNPDLHARARQHIVQECNRSMPVAPEIYRGR
jgi:hypothetical protein